MTDQRGSQDDFILGDKEVIPGGMVLHVLALHYNTAHFSGTDIHTYTYERQCNSRSFA